MDGASAGLRVTGCVALQELRMIYNDAKREYNSAEKAVPGVGEINAVKTRRAVALRVFQAVERCFAAYLQGVLSEQWPKHSFPPIYDGDLSRFVGSLPEKVNELTHEQVARLTLKALNVTLKDCQGVAFKKAKVK